MRPNFHECFVLNDCFGELPALDLKIKGRLALVTGSTMGIGHAVAEALASEGARVVVNGRNEARVRNTVAELSRLGEAHGIAADLATAAGAQEALGALSAIGPVDILVNNVGYFEVKDFGAISDRDWLDMFELNVMSGVRLSRALLPGMLKRDWGRIVFIASDQSAKPNPGMAHYAISRRRDQRAAQRVDGGIIRSLFRDGITRPETVLCASRFPAICSTGIDVP